MSEKRKKSTGELEKELKGVHPANAESYLEENASEMLAGEKDFASYMRAKLKEKGILKQDVLLNADIPQRYGYKLLSEEKRTRRRDIILRICYAAKFTLEEAQMALQIYGMPRLYARNKRDAFLMTCFNERPGSLIEVNQLLFKAGLDPLMTAGVQE